MQIDTCVYPQCGASIVLTVYVCIQELPGTCSSLHVMHTHNNPFALKSVHFCALSKTAQNSGNIEHLMM